MERGVAYHCNRVSAENSLATRAHTVPKFLLEGFCSEANEGRHHKRPALWVGTISTGKIERRAPSNTGLSRGLYDGPGGFSDTTKSIEAHLSKIENNAAIAIRRLAAAEVGSKVPIPEIFRFIAWQAARTPGWMEAEQRWIDDLGWSPSPSSEVAPPEGIDGIQARNRPLTVENPLTMERREVDSQSDFQRFVKQGWRWIPSRDDKLEMLHLQAWYFQQRHLPRLTWLQLRPPNGEDFIISDRGVSWLVDGYADMPPGMLNDPAAEVIAPLTRKLVLVGRGCNLHGTLTPRDVNLRIAFAASGWIAGPTEQVVQQALKDRANHLRAHNLRIVPR